MRRQSSMLGDGDTHQQGTRGGGPVAHGLSNDEIAETKVLSPATAKTHVSRVMIKLGARDRAQLVVFAYQTGLVIPRAAGQAPGPLVR
jgi:Bacterial regulatory proteins, luxR family